MTTTPAAPDAPIASKMLNSDAFAWYMEKDPVLRSTIVAVCRLEHSPDWASLRNRVDRLTRFVPSLRMRVQAPPMRVGPPRWSVDESFDLDFHLRRIRLGESAGWDDVLEFARRAAMDDFDRSRPLWEFTLLEGLADGGAALVTKLHHSLSDGIGGVQLAAYVVDLAAEPGDLEEAPPEPGGHGLSAVRLATMAVGDDVRDAASTFSHTVTGLPRFGLTAALHPLSTIRDAAATTVSIGRFVMPVNRQISSVLGDRRTGRRLATIDVPLADLRAAAKAGGGHLNDAFLAAVTDGMHRYHERRGAPLEDVRVTVPMSIRRPDDPIGGNRITLTRIKMPAAIAEPGDRIRDISAIMAKWQKEPALDHTQGIAFGLNLLPRAYLAGIFKRIELLASDVPGIPVPIWIGGARVTGYYPFGPTIGSAVNATLMSYDGTCHVGLNVDTGAVDDPDALIECMREGFDGVLALARPRRRRRTKSHQEQ